MKAPARPATPRPTPTGALPPPTCQGEDIVSTCPAPPTGGGIYGYEFTVPESGGPNLTDNDFGNHKKTPECPEDPNRAAMMTRTVMPGQPNGGGGVPGDPANYQTVQAAYNAAKSAANANQNEVIGLFSKTTENVTLDTWYSKSMTITQCTSAQVTAADSSKPVWDITSTKKLLIIGPDSVGGKVGWLIEGQGGHELKSIRSNGASEAGVRILTNGNSVSFNNVASGGIGIDVQGNSNTLKSGTIGPNSGAGVKIGAGKTGNNVSGMTIQNNGDNGVLVEGNSNTIDSNKLSKNAPNGVKVTGGTNTISSNGSDENSGDGYNIAGSGTTLKNNKGQKNTGDGIDLSGTGQKPTGNAPQTNSGVAWRITGQPTTVVTGASSNKANGSSIPAATKCPGYFTNAGGATCNP